MFQCHSPKSSCPLPLPQSQKVCSVHGNLCTPVVDSCWCMAKPIQYCKVKKIKIFLKKDRRKKNAVHWSLISSYVASLWPHGIHNSHIKKSWWGKSILLNQNLAKLCELQKYKLARNINHRKVFICPYVVWSILMDLSVSPFSQLCNWKDPDYSITFIYI